MPAVEKNGPIEAWIIDDTSFPKQGKHSVGVHHQYCGQLGKQANCQVAVSLSIANHAASLPVTYRLYLPEAWTKDRARRNKAGMLTAASVALGVVLAIGGLVTAVLVQAASAAQLKAEQKQTKDALDREKNTTDALSRSLASEERTGYFRSITLAERELAAGNVGRVL